MANKQPHSQRPLIQALEGSKQVFHGVRFDVHRLEIERHGKLISRDVVVHPGAVAILPIVDDSHIILIRNSRFAVGKTIWEIPAGTLEPGEPPLETAKRELIEETGYSAKEVKPLLSFYTSPGFTNEIMHVFVAKQLTHVGQQLEATEEIDVEIVTWKSTLQMIQDGTITDGKTITTLLYYHTYPQ